MTPKHILALATVLVGVAAVALGWVLANKSITNPPLEVLVEDTHKTPAMGPSGRFVAVVRADRKERVEVMDPVTGQVVDHFSLPVPARPARPRLFLDVYGWGDDGTLWATASAVDRKDACVSAAAFNPATGQFIPRECSDIPSQIRDRRFTNPPPPNDVLPPGADGPSRHVYGIDRTVQSPDGSLYAVKVTDREHSSIFTTGGRIFPIYDIRILDRAGNFVAQFGKMAIIGWAHDGSLIVHDYPNNRIVSKTWSLARIPPEYLTELRETLTE